MAKDSCHKCSAFFESHYESFDFGLAHLDFVQPNICRDVRDLFVHNVSRHFSAIWHECCECHFSHVRFQECAYGLFTLCHLALSMAPAILVALLIGFSSRSLLLGYFGFAFGALLTLSCSCLLQIESSGVWRCPTKSCRRLACGCRP